MPTSPRPSRRLAPLLPIAAAFALLGAPGAVLADCMMPPPIEEAVKSAEVVFVGTVVAVQDQGRRATVEVEEVWRGPDLPVTTVVLGGQGEGLTSVDRTYEVGMKYVFFPSVDPESRALVDNLCTNTTPWQDDYEAVRPAEARPPIGEPSTEPVGFDVASLVPIGGLVLVVSGVLLVVGLVARGREA
ncbi:MAG: hypothetical protein FIA92_09150 [Chloroflexi bacterium]|nr:hypothetical protein [Chloroflexota bacterium]